MKSKIRIGAMALLATLLPVAAFAATAEEFEAAYKAAAAHEKETVANKNQWPAVKTTLAAARKAADAKDFDKALELAKHADALTQAAIYQSKSEETAWKDAAIK